MSKLSISKSLAAKRNQRGPRNSVQASTARKGRDKVPAGRKAVVTKGLGTTLVKHMHDAGNTVRQDLLVISKCNIETMQQAVNEIVEARDNERKAAKADLNSALAKRKAASINSGYSRILGVIKAFMAGYNVDKILAQTSLSLMYAFAAQGKVSTKRTGKQLTGSGFAAWDKKLDRVVTKSTDSDALARLEEHFRHCLKVLAKFEHVTSIPVKAILATAGKGRKTSNLRRVA